MQLEFLQDEPKLTLMFPYKDTFNRVGGPSMISISVMILWILKRLMTYNTDFADKIVMAVALIYAPLLLEIVGKIQKKPFKIRLFRYFYIFW